MLFFQKKKRTVERYSLIYVWTLLIRMKTQVTGISIEDKNILKYDILTISLRVVKVSFIYILLFLASYILRGKGSGKKQKEK